jgi:hypothetical protein
VGVRTPGQGSGGAGPVVAGGAGAVRGGAVVVVGGRSGDVIAGGCGSSGSAFGGPTSTIAFSGR